MRDHWTIATVACAHIDDAVAAIQQATADAVEVRLDALWPEEPDIDVATDQLMALTDAAPIPKIATLRPLRQGGSFDGDEQVRLSLLASAARAGFQILDVEADNAELPQLIAALRTDAASIIASTHLPKPPSKDQGVMSLQVQQDAGADLHKLAWPAGAFPEYLRALELAQRFRGVHGRPATVPIGYGGAMGRALLPLAGNRATYGHADGSPPVTPGIPSLSSIQRIWQNWGLADDDLADSSGQWLAVIGDPVDHSLSPSIHNAWLRTAGRPERFGALTVPGSIGSVRLLFGVAARIGLVGAGVTAPLKVHALEASQPDETAMAVGAANTVRFDHGVAHSTNTDSTGLQSLLKGHSGSVGVLGAGGAARAAIHAAQSLGLDVTFTSRDAQRAQDVQQDMDASWVPWQDRDTIDASAWIQCTSLGSKPDDPSPINHGSNTALAIEMVYATGTTQFERDAAAAGARVIGGEDVLRNQAADQYRFWTGQDPPETP